MLICVRILTTLVSPNCPEQLHLASLPHPSHLPMRPGAPFKLSPRLSVLLELCWRSMGFQLSHSHDCAWLWILVIHGLTSHLGVVLPCHCGPVWQSPDLTLACGVTSWLDLRPALSTQTCMMVWTLGWPYLQFLGLCCLSTVRLGSSWREATFLLDV